jgi:transitional endoplasmic reticulum ATPase
MAYLFNQMSTALSQEFAGADFTRDDRAKSDYLHHSSGQRVETDAVIIQALHAQYPHKCITTINNLDLIEYGRAGNAEVTILTDYEPARMKDKPLFHKGYLAPARRLDSDQGRVYESLQFGRFSYNWKGHNLIVYVVSGSSGMYQTPPLQYVIGGTDELANELIMEVGAWSQLLRNEIWVYDQGYWQKDAAMYRSVKKAKWEDVILDADRKKAIQDEVVRFFNGQERYAKLNVPWKRGVICKLCFSSCVRDRSRGRVHYVEEGLKTPTAVKYMVDEPRHRKYMSCSAQIV